jgi:hypothetical protein
LRALIVLLSLPLTLWLCSAEPAVEGNSTASPQPAQATCPALASGGLTVGEAAPASESQTAAQPPSSQSAQTRAEGPAGCSGDCLKLKALQAEVSSLKEQLLLWGDRGRVDLVEAIILQENPSIPFQPRRDMAKTFVKTADKLGIPFLAGVAIADVESNFSNSQVGHHGESSLMQILPLPGRPTCAQLRADPDLAITWALTNCFSPAYQQSATAGKSVDEALKAALRQYNDHDSYVDKVYQRYLWMKDFEAKGLYGWD